MPADPVLELRGLEIESVPDGSVEAGIWECTPGKWRRQVKLAEFCQFLSGHCIFHPDGGERLEIRGGDTVFFPENTTGVWEVVETVRKSYVVFKRDHFLQCVWAWKISHGNHVTFRSPE